MIHIICIGKEQSYLWKINNVDQSNSFEVNKLNQEKGIISPLWDHGTNGDCGR